MGLQYNYQLMLANATQGQIFSPVSFTRTNRWGCRKHGAQSFLLMYMAEIDPFPSRTAFLYIYIYIYKTELFNIYIRSARRRSRCCSWILPQTYITSQQHTHRGGEELLSTTKVDIYNNLYICIYCLFISVYLNMSLLLITMNITHELCTESEENDMCEWIRRSVDSVHGSSSNLLRTYTWFNIDRPWIHSITL